MFLSWSSNGKFFLALVLIFKGCNSTRVLGFQLIQDIQGQCTMLSFLLTGFWLVTSTCNSWILVNFFPCWTSSQFWLACVKRECQDSQEIEVLCPLKQKISDSLQSEIKVKVSKGMFQSFYLRLERILSKLTTTPKTLQFSFERVQATPQQCMKPCVWLGIYMEGKQEIRRDNRFSSNE